jgi:hypothetical protein
MLQSIAAKGKVTAMEAAVMQSPKVVDAKNKMDAMRTVVAGDADKIGVELLYRTRAAISANHIPEICSVESVKFDPTDQSVQEVLLLPSLEQNVANPYVITNQIVREMSAILQFVLQGSAVNWNEARFAICFDEGKLRRVGLRGFFSRDAIDATNFEALNQAPHGMDILDQPLLQMAQEFVFNPDMVNGLEVAERVDALAQAQQGSQSAALASAPAPAVSAASQGYAPGYLVTNVVIVNGRSVRIAGTYEKNGKFIPAKPGNNMKTDSQSQSIAKQAPPAPKPTPTAKPTPTPAPTPKH